jgi:hypothetical protein
MVHADKRGLFESFLRNGLLAQLQAPGRRQRAHSRRLLLDSLGERELYS